MLTPYFELNQTDDKLIILIHAPYSNIAEAEIYVDSDDFRFYSSPYYLRLHLPGHVESSEEPPVSYNADNGQFTIELIKLIQGEHFEDLDLIAKFLSPRKNNKVQVKPNIQVLSSSTNADNEEGDDDEDPYDSSEEWFIEQKEPLPISSQPDAQKFGFANTVSNVSNIIEDEEFDEVFDIILNVNWRLPSERTKSRVKEEQEKFYDDHYLFDLMEPAPPLTTALTYDAGYNEKVVFTKEETEALKFYGNKEFLLSKEQRQIAYFSLVDILYGYAYDVCTTEGESTVESAWTINKISATLSWLQNYNSMKEVVICCIRRALCYPLFRHWELSVKVLDDTVAILRSGVRQVIRCLLKIQELFFSSESRYILNQLYITEYFIWLQNEKDVDKKLSKLADMILEVKTTLQKSDVGLDIDILDAAACSTVEEYLARNMSNVKLENSSSEDSEESSDTSSDSQLDSDDDSHSDCQCDEHDMP